MLATTTTSAADIPPIHQTRCRRWRRTVGAATGNRSKSGSGVTDGCCTCARHCSKSCETSSAVWKRPARVFRVQHFDRRRQPRRNLGIQLAESGAAYRR